jgi:hypothetical protein
VVNDEQVDGLLARLRKIDKERDMAKTTRMIESSEVAEPSAPDHAAELEALRAKVAAAADQLDRDLVRWGDEKFNEGVREAAKVVRAILG